MSSHYRYIPSKLIASFHKAKEELGTKSSKDLQDEEDDVDDDKDKDDREEARVGHRSGSPFVVAATQITGAGLPDSDIAGFIQRAERAIVMAVQMHGAHVVLLPELWAGPYFCQSQQACLLELADPLLENVLVTRMQVYAKKYNVVLPLSFYERCNNVLYNSVVVVDADGTLCNGGACYRKSHIPDGTGEKPKGGGGALESVVSFVLLTFVLFAFLFAISRLDVYYLGYQEKFYFSPGDSGFRVFDTAVGRVGCLICKFYESDVNQLFSPVGLLNFVCFHGYIQHTTTRNKQTNKQTKAGINGRPKPPGPWPCRVPK